MPYFNGEQFQQNTQHIAKCIQNPVAGNPAESEDCLFINSIRPANIPAHTKLPVMFYVHGGAFMGKLSLRTLREGSLRHL